MLGHHTIRCARISAILGLAVLSGAVRWSCVRRGCACYTRTDRTRARGLLLSILVQRRTEIMDYRVALVSNSWPAMLSGALCVSCRCIFPGLIRGNR